MISSNASRISNAFLLISRWSAVLHMSDTTRANRCSVSMSCKIFDALFVIKRIYRSSSGWYT